MKKLAYTFISLLGLMTSVTAQNGRVGINTSSPFALLHVKDSSVLFTGLHPLPGTPGNPPATASGTRMMWYADKAAFRAGNILGTQWDKDSIGLYSVAMGHNTKAKGTSSVALGFETKALGIRSFAMGSNATASGGSSIAVGGGTIASHAFTVALGDLTTASGYASVAMGTFTTASGSASVALGGNTSATGHTSTAIGNATLASGESSVALGFGTKAIGYTAAAMGNQTKAKSYASFVIGQHNDTSSISSTTWELPDPLFIIGNGTAFNARSNAMTVLKNGNVGIGTKTPGFLLEVNGTVAKPGGGSWANSSDLRLKQDIKPYLDGLNQLMQINPVSYRYNESSGYDTQSEYIGVIAQELKEIAPYMVSVSDKKTKDGADEYLQVDNSAMTYMLINAVKEQQEIIKRQQDQIDFILEELTAVKQQFQK